jgi:RES domain-containing protein
VTYDTDLLEALSLLQRSSWEGIVYRHMFGTTPPEKVNQLGARWNPAEVEAIYCCRHSKTAIAEGDFQIAMQPLKPKAERRIHRIQVRLSSVVQLTDWKVLEKLGIDHASFESVEPPRCKQIGGAVAHLGHDGLAVPSARHDGINLVIYPDNRQDDYVFDPLDFLTIS